ncbi:MAG: DUF748 domain-containing protein [Flavobacteriales bacterium]|nr:MAG: DUF748 domain-containing protein [Flavobacteriales bacterium]
MSRKIKILTGITITLISILFFLPTVLKNYVVKNSKELIGRQIEIGKLKYNYFTSTTKVYGFKMYEQNEKDEFTTFDTLIVNIEPYRFLLNEKVVEQFYIKGLMVNTILKDSVFNFDDLIAFHSQETDTTTETESETFKYDISNIELKDANFYFENSNVNHVTQIEDFSFFIPNIGWDQAEKSNADVKFNFKNGGYLESNLNLNPASGEFDAVIVVKDLILRTLFEYVTEYAEVNDFNGRLNSQIEISGNTNDAINSIISGHVDVNDFLMTDKNDKDVLASKRIDFNLKRVDYAHSSYVLDSLKFSRPYLYFQMDSITNNIFKLFKLDPNGDPIVSASENGQETDTNATNLYYAINHLSVDDGVLDYSDNLTGEPINYHLSDIKMDSDSIISDSNWVNVYSDMLLNNRGTLNAKLGFNPSDYTNLNLDLTIENFLLSDINIYSRYYTGHSILLGDFYYYSNSKITNGNIASENNLLVKNVEVENNKNGLFSLPLKFALFLLKDKNGDVNLEIPVRGDLNDPSISIGKIIWTTFKKRITGAASNPVNSLASMVDVDPKDYKEFVFGYTDTIPNETQMGKLDKLLEMESQKDGLKIELVHFIDPELQRDAIVFSELGKQYFNDTQNDYRKNEKDFETYLRTKSGNDSLNVKDAAYQLLKPATADSLATIYNEKLIKNTSDHIKASKATTNIKVLKSALKEPDNVGSKSRFEIKFDMLDEKNNQGDDLNN